MGLGVMRYLVFGCVVAGLAMTAIPVSAQDAPPPAKPQDEESAPSWTFSSGLDYSSGRYGAKQSTDILVGLSNITLKTGDFQFSAALPYLSIVGPAYVVVGAGGALAIVNPKAGATSTQREGLGDLNLSATYTLQPEDFGGFEADFTGRTKIATADASKGLSSGETDFGFSVEVSRQIDIWEPFVTFGYTVPGSPVAYSLNSAPSFSVGTSVQLDDNLIAIASYDFNGSISSSLADAQQLFGSLSWVFNDSLTLTGYAELGLSSGSPAQGTGLLLSWKIN